MLLVTELDLFTISTIILPKPKILMIVAANAKIDIDTKTNIDFKTNINIKIGINKPIFDFPHTLNKILMDIMLARIKV
jgi:hypothetical protein